MNIVERVAKIIITFVVFVVAQALLAGSISTMFDLIPLKIDRLFPRVNDAEDGVNGRALGDGESDAKGNLSNVATKGSLNTEYISIAEQHRL